MVIKLTNSSSTCVQFILRHEIFLRKSKKGRNIFIDQATARDKGDQLPWKFNYTIPDLYQATYTSHMDCQIKRAN